MKFASYISIIIFSSKICRCFLFDDDEFRIDGNRRLRNEAGKEGSNCLGRVPLGVSFVKQRACAETPESNSRATCFRAYPLYLDCNRVTSPSVDLTRVDIRTSPLPLTFHLYYLSLISQPHAQVTTCLIEYKSIFLYIYLYSFSM